MGEYFNPWRRKIGVATLLIACAFAAGWVRSLIVEDFIGNSWYSRNGAIEHVVYLSEARLLVLHVDESGNEISSVEESVSALQEQLPTAGAGQRIPSPGIKETTERSIPYWSIVVPLTLLTVWLLLSNPKPPKRIQPA